MQRENHKAVHISQTEIVQLKIAEGAIVRPEGLAHRIWTSMYPHIPNRSLSMQQALPAPDMFPDILLAPVSIHP